MPCRSYSYLCSSYPRQSLGSGSWKRETSRRTWTYKATAADGTHKRKANTRTGIPKANTRSWRETSSHLSTAPTPMRAWWSAAFGKWKNDAGNSCLSTKTRQGSRRKQTASSELARGASLVVGWFRSPTNCDRPGSVNSRSCRNWT